MYKCPDCLLVYTIAAVDHLRFAYKDCYCNCPPKDFIVTYSVDPDEEVVDIDEAREM